MTLFDTGGQVSAVTASFVEKHGLEKHTLPSPLNVRGVGGTVSTAQQYVKLTLNHESTSFCVPALVQQTLPGFDALVGSACLDFARLGRSGAVLHLNGRRVFVPRYNPSHVNACPLTGYVGYVPERMPRGDSGLKGLDLVQAGDRSWVV